MTITVEDPSILIENTANPSITDETQLNLKLELDMTVKNNIDLTTSHTELVVNNDTVDSTASRSECVAEISQKTISESSNAFEENLNAAEKIEETLLLTETSNIAKTNIGECEVTVNDGQPDPKLEAMCLTFNAEAVLDTSVLNK